MGTPATLHHPRWPLTAKCYAQTAPWEPIAWKTPFDALDIYLMSDHVPDNGMATE
jgi:hypothetical protein